MTNDIIAIARKALLTEIFAAAVYNHLAVRYKDTPTGKAFSEVSEMERGHVLFWSSFLHDRGVDASLLRHSSMRFVLHKLLLRVIGKALTIRIMENDENQAIELYSSILDGPGLSTKERESITRVVSEELLHENLLTDEETSLGSLTAYVKDAVLGMSDGLVEILSVTTGLVGATGSTMAVAISGVVVGVAGGISMAISTYTSTRSQRQVHEGILRRVVSASKFVGHIFKERVLDHLEKRGYSKKLSGEVAEETARDSRLLSEVIAEQEYGLKEENLGKPKTAALYAGLAHIIATFIPLIPYFFISNIMVALVVSLILAIIALAIAGFFISVLANMSPKGKMIEMIITGLGAAAITYIVGKAVSVLLTKG
ncbi:MAG: VIT1/CCC1 transporter family protein [Chloroflexota bacterium]